MAYKAKQPCVYISQRGGRKKIYKDKFVYLRDQDEFDIELSNPTKDTVLASIELNGKSISNSGLVLRPGENFILRRFIDDNGKFVFNTYDIDGSDSDMVEATAENGKLKVLFYKEKTVKQQFCNPITWYPAQPYYYYPNQYPYYSPTICGCSEGTSCNCNSAHTLTLNNDNCTFGSTITNTGGAASGISGNSVNVNYCATGNSFGAGEASFTTTSNFTSSTGYSLGDLGLGELKDEQEEFVGASLDFMETGRVEKGSVTDQSFEYVDMDFETYHSYTSELTIMPESRKPIEKADLNKVFCHKCGRKAKQADSFCSDCGTELK